MHQGFSTYLQTLAKLVPEGLWVDEIFINQENNSASIKGYETKPDAVSLLMQSLQNAHV